MKKVLPIILAATFLSFIASPVWSAGTLEVTTPNGGQKWATGKKYTIKWSKGNAGTYVKIQLLKSGKAYKTIKAKTKNDGKYRWKIPSSVKTGSAYKIKIISVSKQTVRDRSNKNFTITKVSTTATGGDGDTIEVTSPDGGELWTTGKRYTIKWDKGDGKGKVKIELLKSGKAYKTIKTRTKNDGKQRWKVPTSVTTGSAYKIKVTSTTDSSNTDSSDSNFTITGSKGGTSDTPAVSLNCTPPSVTENGGIFTCELLLSKPTSEKVTVKVSYSGTATKGTDYTDDYRNDNTTHPIAAGKTSTSWKMTGISDTTTEGNETIIVAIDSVTNGTEAGKQRTTLELTEATATNPTVSLNCTPPSVTENGGIFTCELLLSKPTSEKVTVKVSYSGTATKGTDYTDDYRNDNTTHPIAAGKTSTSWKMTGISDTTTEGNETIIVAIDSVTNGTEAGKQKTTLELTEATATNPTVSLNCTPPSVTENGGIFTCELLLSKPTSEKVTVKVSYSGTATKGTDYADDYRNDNTTHPIAAGKTSTSWKMTGISDTTTEGNETIIVAIDSVTNGTEAGKQKTTLELTE